jgi:CelD/BcsL family acetyltransferase involved in cellulose biosynthesis
VTVIGEQMAPARSVRVVDSLDAIEGIRDRWEAAPVGRQDADIDFYLAFAASRPAFVRPYVLMLERGDELEAMLVARVEDVRLRAGVGYRTVFSARTRSITLVHGGLVGVDDENAPVLLEALQQSLARREADVLFLPAQRTDSPLYRAALDALPAYRRQPFDGHGVHRALALPDTFDEFLRSRSKSTRDSVKRYRKKVERDLGAKLELRVYREPADIERIFADTEPVAALTYQRGLGVALADTPEQRALVEVGLRHGWYRVWVLSLDGRTIAFWPGSTYDGTFHVGTPGYDPAYGEYRIGNYLLMRMFEDLIADPDVHAVDYGQGDAEYKRRFGSESWEEADLRVFAPTPRALAINAVRSAVLGAAEGARAVLRRAGVLERVKRGWRRRLARSSSPG